MVVNMWTNADLLFFPLGTKKIRLKWNFNEYIKLFFEKKYLKMLPVKEWLFGLGLNMSLCTWLYAWYKKWPKHLAINISYFIQRLWIYIRMIPFIPIDSAQLLKLMKFPLDTGDGALLIQWPSYAIWWNRSWSTLVQVMACCLTAPSHYLTQYWLIMSGVFLPSLWGQFHWKCSRDLFNFDMRLKINNSRLHPHFWEPMC